MLLKYSLCTGVEKMRSIRLSLMAPAKPFSHERATISSRIFRMMSISSLISSTLRFSNLLFLYVLQKAHLPHGQFLVNLTRRLYASLGGRMGPISYRIGVLRLLFSFFW